MRQQVLLQAVAVTNKFKNMNNYLILIFSFIIISCKAQTNEISFEKFSNIKIDNILLSDIRNTKGNENLVKSLLDNSFEVEKGDEPSYWIKFVSSRYKLVFKDGQNIHTGVVDDYQLTSLLVVSSSISVDIDGVSISLGDNISKLPNANETLTYSDGRVEKVFKIGVQVIEIGYDLSTGVINKIKYVCYNT